MKKILSVVFVIIIIIYYVFNLCRGNSDCSMYGMTGSSLLVLDSRIKLYKKTKGVFPVSLEILDSIPLSKIDPWGNKIIYKISEKKGYELYSMGKNSVDDYGLNDDIKIKGSIKGMVYCPN